MRTSSAIACASLVVCGAALGNAPVAGAGGLALSSSAFASGGRIPQRFASKLCGGENVSPPLSWHGQPPLTRSFAVTIYDPKGRGGGGMWNWVVYDIPYGASGIPSAPDGRLSTAVARLGANGHGLRGYFGPCPPKGELHHYRFTLYALDSSFVQAQKTDPPKVVLSAMSSHVLASATMTATFRH